MDGGGASTSCQRVLWVMGVIGHGDVQGVLDIDLSTEIEEPGDGASRQPLISPQFICSIACAYAGDSTEGTLRVCVYRSRVLG